MSCESFGWHGRKSSQPVSESNADRKKEGFPFDWSLLYVFFVPLALHNIMYNVILQSLWSV